MTTDEATTISCISSWRLRVTEGKTLKAKKETIETYWVPGVNNHENYGRWAFAEFTDVYEMQADFESKVEAAFYEMIERFQPRLETETKK